MLFSLGCAVGSQGLRPASTLELCLRCRSTFLTYSVNEGMPTWWAGISRQAGCAGAPPVAPGGGRFRWRLGAWTQWVSLASPRAEESSSHGNGLFGCGTNGHDCPTEPCASVSRAAPGRASGACHRRRRPARQLARLPHYQATAPPGAWAAVTPLQCPPSPETRSKWVAYRSPNLCGGGPR
jgi:hypothetical protein